MVQAEGLNLDALVRKHSHPESPAPQVEGAMPRVVRLGHGCPPVLRLGVATRGNTHFMIRYNAAHRGAEQDVFPVTDRRGIPVVAFTAQRWGALRKHTPDDPAGFSPPTAPAWYRFALAHPSVSVVLMAPGNRRELEEDLTLLEDWRPPRPEELQMLIAHGQRVRKHAGMFP
jgi:predicted aldo/keto reductase-like oxidoreductase